MNVPENVSAETAQVLLDDLRTYQREQEEDPTNHLPPYHCGLIYAQLGDHGSAVHSYQTAIERNPEFGQAYFNMAIAYSAQGVYDRAEEAYRLATQYNPADAEPWANLGALLQFQGDVEKALEAYNKAVELNPDELEVRRLMALMLYDEGRIEEAEQVFRATVAHDPQNAEAWNSLGLIAFHQERLEDARAHYQKAVDIDERFAQAWSNLGNLYLKQNQEAQAVGAYRKALAGDSDDPTIWFNLGEFFFSRDHPEAEKCLARVVELDRSDMEAWGMLRRWYSRHPHYPSWKSALTVLLADAPDDVSLLRELSYVLEKLGEHAEAIKVLKEVIGRDPEDTESRLLMAGLALRQGKPMDAYQQLRLLDSADDEALDMWQYLGQRLLYHGNDAEAEACFMKVIAHRPGQSSAWKYLGELANRKEEWELAFERFMRAGEINRNDKDVWLPLADRLMEAGAYDKAVDCLNQLSGLLRYLTGDWERFFPVYHQAGRAEELLDKLEQLMFEGALPNRLWVSLAALFSRAGLSDRARVCMERLEESLDNIPDGEALLEQVLLERAAGTPLPPPAEAAQAALSAQAHLEPLAPSERGAALSAKEQEAVIVQSERHQRAIALDASDFRAWFNAGNALFRLGRYSDAERHFLKAGELNPEESKTFYNLGCAREAQGRMALACEGFERAVELQGGFAQAWNWLGVLRYHLHENDLARRAYVRSLAHDRGSAKAWHNLGVLYRRLDEREKSAYCFQESQKLGGV